MRIPHVALTLTLALVLAPALAAAAPTKLSSSVTRSPVEPAVVIVPAKAGKTVLERYRSGARPASDTPLVVIVRLPDANSPDAFAVTEANREGGKIAIAIESRRFRGPLAATDVTTPLVEIALGDLPKGTYTIDIEEQVLELTKVGAPETAAKPRRGLSSAITLTVQ
jgi:hypothetical protein